jgi:hypothetical protein
MSTYLFIAVPIGYYESRIHPAWQFVGRRGLIDGQGGRSLVHGAPVRPLIRGITQQVVEKGAVPRAAFGNFDPAHRLLKSQLNITNFPIEILANRPLFSLWTLSTELRTYAILYFALPWEAILQSPLNITEAEAEVRARLVNRGSPSRTLPRARGILL